MTVAEIAASRYASRKFLLAAATLLIATGLLIGGGLHSAEWVDMVRWTLGLYMAGNVGATAVGRPSTPPAGAGATGTTP